MIKSYKRQPTIIEALQFTGSNHKECEDFLQALKPNTKPYKPHKPTHYHQILTAIQQV